MSICCGTFDRHVFEPRYDEKETIDQVALDKGIRFWMQDGTAYEVDSKLKSKTYLFDICIRCGTKIERSTI
jgi:hypothetical protein